MCVVDHHCCGGCWCRFCCFCCCGCFRRVLSIVRSWCLMVCAVLIVLFSFVGLLLWSILTGERSLWESHVRLGTGAVLRNRVQSCFQRLSPIFLLLYYLVHSHVRDCQRFGRTQNRHRFPVTKHVWESDSSDSHRPTTQTSTWIKYNSSSLASS